MVPFGLFFSNGEPHASTLPRVTFSQQQVRTEEGSFAQLPCVAQGNPPPTYRNYPADGDNSIVVVLGFNIYSMSQNMNRS
ncbi:hypothetical protein CEXT_88831 [Caerostris extrusa]|uniref:Ig-like domain-containing protein n=1 Tax=Caerostris extrusa TaxID=172846 RepID=A0AAV4XX20_CAEEX|nr:hypothetical protein CEXT_88831 [Caerostris extrusa]